MTESKKTKIVCTLGPASSHPEIIEQMILAGMDVARLNFSHGTHEAHRKSFDTVREVSSRLGRKVAVLQDLQGPKIRVGVFPDGGMELRKDQKVVIVPGETQSAPYVIPTTYKALPEDVKPGDEILMDDGLLRLRVEEVIDQEVRCRVETKGLLKDHKGMNLPKTRVSAPALTEKDLADLVFGAELGVDFLSLSFVRAAADIELADRHQREANGSAPIIAKIEKPEAVANLDSILSVADGIMVARGDLGVEMGPEKVPLIQKHAIEAANRMGKLVITATQMLESMVTSTFPTRAEASDVANAVLDQTDAVMLSAETATGQNPVLVVETMARIIREIESSNRYQKLSELPPVDLKLSPNALSHAAVTAAKHLGARAIVCITGKGLTPRLVSDYRPMMPIYALARSEQTLNRLAAFWGVHPVPFEHGATADDTLKRMDGLLIEKELLSAGDIVVVTSAVPPHASVSSNMIKIHIVGR